MIHCKFLSDAIVSQQLSTKVAATILKRVNALIDKKGKALREKNTGDR
jgi:3-methyladenine DNA glycosylase/8-oxoguanine DNA glycosylase